MTTTPALAAVEFADFVKVQTDPTQLAKKSRSLPCRPTTDVTVLLANAVALEVLVCEDAQEFESENELYQLVLASVATGMGWDDDSSSRLWMTNCQGESSLLSQRATYFGCDAIQKEVDWAISEGWDTAQSMAELLLAKPYDEDELLWCELSRVREESGGASLALAVNREGKNNQFFAEAIMARYKAQYRAARPEPHYKFAQTTLARSCLVVEGIDIESEEVQRQQASRQSGDRHDMQIQHWQWQETSRNVVFNAIGGDEVTRNGTPGVSFVGIHAIGVVNSDAPKPYHSFTTNDRCTLSVLYCALLCFTVLCCASLCITVLYCALLCFTVLYCGGACGPSCSGGSEAVTCVPGVIQRFRTRLCSWIYA